MKVLVTAGPTREYIDPVRFISNGSSGKMGYAIAAAAADAGHDVTLLSGPVSLRPPDGVEMVHFVTVAELGADLNQRFDNCDVLVMVAAVGDFNVCGPSPTKLRRMAGPVTIELIPTMDLLAELGRRRRDDQVLVGFAVEDVDPETSAREEMGRKNTDFVVVNTPEALAADHSRAAVLARGGDVVVPWADRPKDELARAIVGLFGRLTR